MIEAGSDIVALDGTLRKRTAKELETMIRRLKADFPHIPLMADIATMEEGLLCEAIGFDILSTTLSGYTRETMSDSKEPDYRLAGELKQKTRCFVNAEGKNNGRKAGQRNHRNLRNQSHGHYTPFPFYL